MHTRMTQLKSYARAQEVGMKSRCTIALLRGATRFVVRSLLQNLDYVSPRMRRAHEQRREAIGLKMNLERRSLQREKPEKLSYIQFEPEGGGIVLNASEYGLAFHSANAIREPSPIRLSISPNPRHRLELIAEIVWLDDAKKFGGLRFTEVTADARNGIRKWLAQTAESRDPDSKHAAPSDASKEESASRPDVGEKTADSPQLISSHKRARSNASGYATLAVPGSFSAPSPSHLLGPFLQRDEAAPSHTTLLRGLALGALLFGLLFTAFLFLPDFRYEVGNSLMRLGEKLKHDDKDAPSETSSPPAVRRSGPSIDNSSGVPDAIREIPSSATLDPAHPATSAQSTEGTGDSLESRHAEVKNFRTDTEDTHSRSDRSTLAQQLWSGVGAGDSSAEAALAQLYLTGDGVPRNCEQARVLLRAASKKGNTGALQQLRRLNNNHTCP